MARRDRFGKVHIVHLLAERYGYRRYLELATPTTGKRYQDVEQDRFDVCSRFLYHCPADFDDGQAVDYRTPDLDISAGLTAINAMPKRFDVMLVDPFHTYTESHRDIAEAFNRLAPGGAIVVHDCMPPDETYVAPEYHDGPWCGLTYKAFLDFVLGRRDLRYLTVDADYGCGVIRKTGCTRLQRIGGLTDRRRRKLIREWQSIGDDIDAAWKLFERRKADLLRLVTVADFSAEAFSLGPKAD